MACFGISSIILLRQNFNLTVQKSNIVNAVKVRNTVSCLCYFMSLNSDEQSQSLGFGRPLAEIDQICFRLGSTTGPNFKGCVLLHTWHSLMKVKYFI